MADQRVCNVAIFPDGGIVIACPPATPNKATEPTPSKDRVIPEIIEIKPDVITIEPEPDKANKHDTRP